jgi:hypothetical protein
LAIPDPVSATKRVVNRDSQLCHESVVALGAWEHLSCTSPCRRTRKFTRTDRPVGRMSPGTARGKKRANVAGRGHYTGRLARFLSASRAERPSTTSRTTKLSPPRSDAESQHSPRSHRSRSCTAPS